jgi:S1-C subfamily serine protease
VAQEFCARDGDSWRFRPGLTTRVDFLRELGSTAALEFEITEAIGIHDRHDLALLRVERASSDGQELPDPLVVAAKEPADLYERDVYVVGYPAWDSRRNEPEPIRRIFSDVYNVKRLQPGKAVAYSTEYSAIQHDCSTLGGNSGSPVVDLETNQVIGLHFGGRYGVGNYAVPLWALAEDPLLSLGDLNFQ